MEDTRSVICGVVLSGTSVHCCCCTNMCVSNQFDGILQFANKSEFIQKVGYVNCKWGSVFSINSER